MTEVINIRFRNTGKVYYFSPDGLTVQPGDYVIVETAKGLEYGECTAGNHMVDDTAIVPPLRPAIRTATEDDKQVAALNREKEAKAFNICLQKIEAHKLDMKLVDVEYSFEGNKILFFFTSDGRVDFRELVKDLVSVFRARIELRQIGVRDGAKMLGGLGICGRPFCCSSFLDDFHPVSIKMAKTQSLSLNPTKISGTCGRLMCCLKYEQAAYEDLLKSSPKVSASVVTPFGQGIVTDVNLLRQTVKVRVDEGDFTGMHDVPFCDIGKTVSCVPVEDATAAPKSFDSKHPDPPAYNQEKPRNAQPPSAQPGARNQPRQNNNAPRQNNLPRQNTAPKQNNMPKPITELSSIAPAVIEDEKSVPGRKKTWNKPHNFPKKDKPETAAREKETNFSEDESAKPQKSRQTPFKKRRRKPKPPAAPQE